MSEERNIRINKVLRELNISLERAVDYLKDKGIVVESNPNAKISDTEFGILQNQFAGDKGNKEASKGVGEEIKKEKEALRIEREKEVEDKKRQADEERQRQEIIKAKATVVAPKQVGTIDLNPKPTVVAKQAEAVVVPTKPVQELTKQAVESVEATKESVAAEKKPEAKSEKATTKAKVEPKTEVVEPKAAPEVEVPEDHTTQYQKLSGDRKSVV